jgi:iron complex transport system substrate-binding protein
MTLIDQLGRSCHLSRVPVRIISLVPSLTETLVDLGLGDQIIGVTKFCVHPSDLRSKSTVIGGTKNPRIHDIIGLQPDLIIANKEENRIEDITELGQLFPVYVSDIKNVADTINFILDMNTIFADLDIKDILSGLKQLNTITITEKISACYLIWKNPWMTIGHDTFIHHIMEKFGYQNVFGDQDRYPSISIADIASKNPDLIFLSSEPYPFKESDIIELSSWVQSKIILVDGEIFSWYGTRMLRAKEYFSTLKLNLGK